MQNFKDAENKENWILETHSVSDSDMFGSSDISGGIDGLGDEYEPDFSGHHKPNPDSFTPPPRVDPNAPMPGGKQTNLNVGENISAPVVIGVIDQLAPIAIKMGFSAFGYDLNAKSLKLTAQEKNALEEPTQNYLDTLNVKLSPLEGFCLALLGVYAGKTVQAFHAAKEDKKAPKKTRAAKSTLSQMQAFNQGEMFKDDMEVQTEQRQRKTRSDKGQRNPNNSRVRK